MKTLNTIIEALENQNIDMHSLLTESVELTEENEDVKFAFFAQFDESNNVSFGFCHYITNEDKSWESAFEQQTGKVIGYVSANDIEFASPMEVVIERLKYQIEEYQEMKNEGY